MMEYRIANAADTDSVRQLWAYAFNGDEPFASWYFANFYNYENALGCWRDGRLQAMLHMHPYQLYLRGGVVDAYYIVGVATDPSARRSGLTGPLLAAALAEMRRRKRPVSILMPFKAGFYYPFDWRLCYHHLKYSLSLEELRSVVKPWGQLRPVGLADIDLLDGVYRDFVSGRHGYVVRNLVNWQHIISEHLNDQGHIYLLEDHSRPEGYIMYNIRSGKIIVREIVYRHNAAYLALLDFLYGHRSHAHSAEWNSPLDTQDKVLFSLFEAKQDVRVFPFMSARIVDVAMLLKHCRYPLGEYHVNIAVCDNLAPWNDRTIGLRITDGQAQIEAPSEGGQVKITVGALTQLVFGRLTASDLAANAELLGSSAMLESLEQLFPRCDNYINEYY